MLRWKLHLWKEVSQANCRWGIRSILHFTISKYNFLAFLAASEYQWSTNNIFGKYTQGRYNVEAYKWPNTNARIINQVFITLPLCVLFKRREIYSLIFSPFCLSSMYTKWPEMIINKLCVGFLLSSQSFV